MWVLETRYEYWGREGKTWTKWFVSGRFVTEEEGKSQLKTSKELSKSIDKATKLKHEFNLREMSKEEVEEYNNVLEKMKDDIIKRSEKEKKKSEKKTATDSKKAEKTKTKQPTKRGK